MDKCPKCGYEEPIDYFELISQMKLDYEGITGFTPTHLIVNIKEHKKMECSDSILDRLVYIKDTVREGLISGLKIIKTQSIEGIKVVYIP